MANTYYLTRETVASTFTGGTLTSALLFSADNTHDIGASGATRPRDFFLGRNATVGGTLGVTGAATFSSTVATGALSVTGAITSTTTVTASQNIISTLNIEARGTGTLLMGTVPTNGFYYRNTSALSLGNGFVNRLADNGLAITGKKNNASGAVAVGIGAVLNVTTANESTVNDNYTSLEVAYETSDATSSAGYYKLFSFKKRSLCFRKTSVKASMPASPEAGDLAVVTDAGAGNWTLALYNGSAWVDITTGATLA